MSSAADAAGFADWCLLCGCQKSEGRLSKSLFCRMVTVIGDKYRKAHTEEKGLLVACGQFLFYNHSELYLSTFPCGISYRSESR